MRWIPNSVVSGIQSIFHGTVDSQNSRIEAALEDIREAMLNELNGANKVQTSKLELRVTYANTIQDLWYLRGDIMEAIAVVDGEALATQKLRQISSMFNGLLPGSLTSRPRRFLAD